MTAAATLPLPHAHRWRIAEQDGRAMLPGVCQHCGAERQFPAAAIDDLSPKERARRAASSKRGGASRAKGAA